MFKLAVKTDNAAFVDVGGELARILRVLAHRVDVELDGKSWSVLVLDRNGNTVGVATYKAGK